MNGERTLSPPVAHPRFALTAHSHLSFQYFHLDPCYRYQTGYFHQWERVVRVLELLTFLCLHSVVFVPVLGARTLGCYPRRSRHHHRLGVAFNVSLVPESTRNLTCLDKL